MRTKYKVPHYETVSTMLHFNNCDVLPLWRRRRRNFKNVQNTYTSSFVRANVYVLTHETRRQDILNWKQ